MASSEKVVLHPFVKSKGLTLFDLPYSEPSDLGLVVISIALTDNIRDGAKHAIKNLPHFDFPLFHVASQLLEILLHHLPFSNFLSSCSITSLSPIS